jgi:hypothetical protein
MKKDRRNLKKREKIRTNNNLILQDLGEETIQKVITTTRKIASALSVTGPFNIQFIAKNNEIKVIEVLLAFLLLFIPSLLPSLSPLLHASSSHPTTPFLLYFFIISATCVHLVHSHS